jgi:hypothetical protein
MNTGSLDNDTVFRMSLVLCLRSETGIILGAFDISSTSYDDINGTINVPFYQEFVVVCYLAGSVSAIPEEGNRVSRLRAVAQTPIG